MIRVLLIGEVGVGKSSVCNTISDFIGDLYKISAEMKACTMQTDYHVVFWKGT